MPSTNSLNILSEETFISKLDAQNALLTAIASGFGGIVDSSFIANSTNAVQSKVIKAALDGKVDSENGKGLSSNDFSSTYKGKLDNIDTEVTSASGNLVTSGAVATAISNLGNLFTIKGVVSAFNQLPDSNNKIGDIYFVGSTAEGNDNYIEYVWTANLKWELIGTAQISADSVVTQNSTNLVTSGAVYTAIASATPATATTQSKGIIQIGEGLSIDANGIVSVTGGASTEDLKNLVFPRIVVSGTNGTSVTATKGQRSVSGTIASGSVTLQVPELGTWTISGGGNSTTVEITAPMQQREVTLGA